MGETKLVVVANGNWNKIAVLQSYKGQLGGFNQIGLSFLEFSYDTLSILGHILGNKQGEEH